MSWHRIARLETPNGVEVTYGSDDTHLTIQTKHETLNRVHGTGTIDYPYYLVLDNGVELKRFKLLGAAKKWAELTDFEYCIMVGAQKNYTGSYDEALSWYSNELASAIAEKTQAPEWFVREEGTGDWFQLR